MRKYEDIIYDRLEDVVIGTHKIKEVIMSSEEIIFSQTILKCIEKSKKYDELKNEYIRKAFEYDKIIIRKDDYIEQLEQKNMELQGKAIKYDEMMTPKKPTGKLVKSCGNCGIVPIDCISNANIKHCWNCGQHIDWSDEE